MTATETLDSNPDADPIPDALPDALTPLASKSDEELTLVDLLRVCRVLNELDVGAEERVAVECFYDRLVERFKTPIGGRDARMVLFAHSGGICLTKQGDLSWKIVNSSIPFDWSSAHKLIYRLEAITDRACEWWPVEPGDDTDDSARAKRRHTRRDRAARVPRNDRTWTARTPCSPLCSRQSISRATSTSRPSTRSRPSRPTPTPRRSRCSNRR